MYLSDNIAALGELSVGACFASAIDWHHGFEATFLGAKAQLLDFRISLLNRDGKVFGPHFNLQVKARTAPALGRAIKVGFTREEVVRAAAMGIPLYVAVMEIQPSQAPQIWIRAVVDPGKGINSISRTHLLGDRATLISIYSEVLAYFDSVKYS